MRTRICFTLALQGAARSGVDGDMMFAEPWEAKAFAIIVKLGASGTFHLAEWVDAFSREVAAATAIEAAGGRPRPTTSSG